MYLKPSFIKLRFLKMFLVAGLTALSSQSLAESDVEYWDNAIRTQTDQAIGEHETATNLGREVEEMKTRKESVRKDIKDLEGKLQSLQRELDSVQLSGFPRITLEEANKNVEQVESKYNKARLDLDELLKQEPKGRPGEAVDPKTLKPEAKVAYAEANRSLNELRRVQAERDKVQLSMRQKEKAADLQAKIDEKQGELSKMKEADRAEVAGLAEKRRQVSEAEGRLSELRNDIARLSEIKEQVEREEAEKQEELLATTPDSQKPQTEKTPAQKNDDLKRDLKKHGKGSKEVQDKFKGMIQSR